MDVLWSSFVVWLNNIDSFWRKNEIDIKFSERVSFTCACTENSSQALRFIILVTRMNLNVRVWLLPCRSNVYRAFRVEFSSFAFSQGDAHFGRNYYTKERTWSVGQVFDTQRLNHAITTAAESWLEHASPTVAGANASDANLCLLQTLNSHTPHRDTDVSLSCHLPSLPVTDILWSVCCAVLFWSVGLDQSMWNFSGFSSVFTTIYHGVCYTIKVPSLQSEVGFVLVSFVSSNLDGNCHMTYWS